MDDTSFLGWLLQRLAQLVLALSLVGSALSLLVLLRGDRHPRTYERAG